MILTKENVASQAFAEHILGLSLPSWIEAKIGRLVGFMALHDQTTGTTKLEIPSAHRHEVIGSKQVIIGCGGGFRHECASKYSPVAQWMSEVDLTLHDESQQYGNLDETAAIARLPRCLVMWLGEHRQTPGGLRKSTAARRFRRKLLKRPLALRGNTNKVQPNTLYQIVGRYLTGTLWLTFNYWTTWRSTTRWTRTYEGLRGARLFHLVSLSLQISLTDLPGSCLGLCVCVACFVVFVGLVVGFFFWGNLISITGSFQLLTDHVSHLSGNAGKKRRYLTGTPLSPAYPVAQLMAPDLVLPQNAQEHLENLAKELLGAYESWLNGIVPRTALAILWLATHRQDVEPMVAQGLIAAAGLRGKQN